MNNLLDILLKELKWSTNVRNFCKTVFAMLCQMLGKHMISGMVITMLPSTVHYGNYLLCVGLKPHASVLPLVIAINNI